MKTNYATSVPPATASPKTAVENTSNKKPAGKRAARRLKLAALIVSASLAFLLVAKPAGTAVMQFFGFDAQIEQNADAMMAEGRQTFRFDTFGDEHFWGDQLMLHRAIAGSRFGGVGPGLSPNAALALGLKVDADAIPRRLAGQIRAGNVDLNDPAVTLELLRLNAVVGVKGFFNDDGSISSVGINCSLCHSTVDDSFAPGIGRRLDGW